MSPMNPYLKYSLVRLNDLGQADPSITVFGELAVVRPFSRFCSIFNPFRGRYLPDATWHANRLSLCGSMYVELDINDERGLPL
jgi:hypothetical protein